MSSTNGAGELSPAPIVLYEHAGRWSAATSVGLLFYGLSAVEAEARLAEAGIASPLVSVDALTWRSTFMAATASELDAINLTLETLPQSADVEAIKSRQEVIAENLAAILTNIVAERQRQAEIAQLEAELQRFARVVKEVNGFTDDEVRAVVNGTAAAKRLRELRQQ